MCVLYISKTKKYIISPIMLGEGGIRTSRIIFIIGCVRVGEGVLNTFLNIIHF